MRILLAPLVALAFALPVIAQQMPKSPPGVADPKRIEAGTYEVDTGHTQVNWQVNHLGFSKYDGQFGGITGTLQLDPRNVSAAKLSVKIPVSGLSTTVQKLTEHLSNPDFFDASRYPAATFTSTRVEARGTSAKIIGDLTLHGVTRPVTLDAQFVGAGPGMMAPNPINIGFEATTRLKRSDFGISMGVPVVSDEVEIRINAAFVKVR